MNNSSLKDKLNNLVNVDGRDYCVFARANNQHISIFEDFGQEDLDNFFHNNFDEIEITFDSFNLKEEIKNLSKEDIEEFIANKKIKMDKTFLLSLMSKQSWREYLHKYCLDYFANVKKRYNFLLNKAREIQRDKGTWNLFVAKYFLKGLSPVKRKPFKAPLLLFMVDIVVKKDRIVIQKIEKNYYFNEKIHFFLSRESNADANVVSELKKLNNIEDDISYLEKIINAKIEVIEDNENDFYHENFSDVASLKEQVIIEPNLCIGIFEPSGGKLKEELEYIINSNEYKQVFDSKPSVSYEQIKVQELTDDPIIQLDKLDVYQRHAVRSSLKDNTIIHGPPGTGKSEVISNIIANVLYDNKNILMVSEKKAALDVLSERLKKLSVFMLKMYDLKNKDDFYNSIQQLSNFLGNSWLFENNIGIDDLTKSDQYIYNGLADIKKYKYSVARMEDFFNYKINDYDFIKLIKEINQKFGSVQNLKTIYNDKQINYLKEFVKSSNKSYKEVFDDINNSIALLKSTNNYDEKNASVIIKTSQKLKEMEIELNIDLTDSYVREKVKNNKNNLDSIFATNFIYKNLLHDNETKFYYDCKSYDEVVKNLTGIYDGNDLYKPDEFAFKVNKFFNIWNLESNERIKKNLIKNFLKTSEIPKKRNKSLFSKKLNRNENFFLENLNKVYELNLFKYKNFNYVYEHKELFNPIDVIYSFNNEIFWDIYTEFIKNNYFNYDFMLLEIVDRNKLNLTKMNELNGLMYLYSEFEKQFPEFVSTNLFTHEIEKCNKKDWEKFQDIILEVIKLKILNKIARLNNHEKEMIEKAFKVANLKRRPSIYAFMEKHGQYLKNVFPIWVSRPEEVALFLNFEKQSFDYGIFDEASQMFLERAYPILYRTKIKIVAGDDKQLRPTNFFASRGEIDDYNYEIDDLDKEESLLDRAKTTTWNEIMLKNHYRSKHRELIEFSSQFIYDGKLNFATVNGIVASNAIQSVTIPGNYNESKNSDEAKKVIEILEKEHTKFKKILIIAVNSPQQELISSYFYNSGLVGEELYKKYSDGDIEVISLENVQGNEADLVILSIVYGKKSPSEAFVASRFGPIIQNGGKNRLNVAITRAKSKMWVVKSIKSSDIKESGNENLMVFKKFIGFVDSIELNKKVDQDFKTNEKIFDSNFEREVYDYIKLDVFDMGLKMLTQYEVGLKKIDIVITDSLKQKVLLGIEVDGWRYHSGKTKIYEDYERQLFLESRGYKIFRILESEWNMNKEFVKKEILIRLKAICEGNNILV